MRHGLSALVVTIAACGQAPTTNLHSPDLTACTDHRDCIVTIADCCPCNFSGLPFAINRIYLEVESARRTSECVGVTCPYAPNEQCDTAQAACVLDRCEVVVD